jgi:hypothetical protein
VFALRDAEFLKRGGCAPDACQQIGVTPLTSVLEADESLGRPLTGLPIEDVAQNAGVRCRNTRVCDGFHEGAPLKEIPPDALCL